jgi:hypothetical protein
MDTFTALITAVGFTAPFANGILFFCCSWDTQCCAWCGRILIISFQSAHFLIVFWIGTILTNIAEDIDEFANEDKDLLKTTQPAMIAILVSIIFVLAWIIFMCTVNEGLKTMRENIGKPVQPAIQMQAPKESY